MLVPRNSASVRDDVPQGGGGYLQQANGQIAMDLGLQLDLDVEVDFQPQAELLALAAVFFFVFFLVFAAFLRYHIL